MITDLAMPGMTCAALARKIREQNPSQSIVLITGYDKSEAGLREAENLFAKMMLKQFTVEDMAELLHRLLGRGDSAE